MRLSMSRHCSLVCAVLTWLLAAHGLRAEDPAPTPGLEPYVNKMAGFQASMPPKPQYNKEKTGEGADDVQHQYLSGAANGVYMVAYQDHPMLDLEDPRTAERLYVAARDGFQKAIGGERKSYEEVANGKLKGREMRFAIPARGGEARSRMFFANKRWYHVFVMGTPEFVNSKTATQFLDSFRVLEPAASAK